MCVKDTIKLNVGGSIFTVPAHTLSRIPGSRLSKIKQSDESYNEENKEFFFDRTSVVFPYILDVYRKGKLHFPRYLCAPLLCEELEYWGIPESLIADCCWRTYASFAHEQRIMREVERALRKPYSENNSTSSESSNDDYVLESGAILFGNCKADKSSNDSKDVSKVGKACNIKNDESVEFLTNSTSIIRKKPKSETEFRKTIQNCSQNNHLTTDKKHDARFGETLHSPSAESSRSNNQLISDKSMSCVRPACLTNWRNKIYTFLEYPKSSNLALIWGWIFLVIVLTSVGIQCLSTHPVARIPLPQSLQGNTSNYSSTLDDASNHYKSNIYLTSKLRPSLRNIQRACLSTFAVEFGLRFLTSPDKVRFMKNIFNIVDVLTFIPMLGLEIIVSVYFDRLTNETVFKVAFLLSLMGVFKIIRIVKFTLQYSIMKVLMLSMKASLPHITLLLVLISIGMLLFSTLIYYAEFYTDNFETIPIGYWWAIVTMTTVGYGDTHPITGWGYVVGSLCAVAGMISTGLPLPVIANNFNFYYKYARVCAFKKRRLKALKSKYEKPVLQVTRL